MTAISIFRKIYRLHLYAGLSAAVVLGLIYFVLLTQPFEPAILDAPFRLIAAALLLFGTLGLVLEMLLTLAERVGRKTPETGYRLFFLPVYEPLDRTRRPKRLADTVRKNRASEVRIVKDFIAGNGRVLQLTGQAGLGKSTLAALVARRTDFWVNLTGRRIGSVELVRLLAEWLGEEEIAAKAAADAAGSEEIERICARIAAKAVRLFFNGFDALLNAEGRIADARVDHLFGMLLRRDGKHKLIIMSRRPLHSDLTRDLNAAFLPLEELGESESAALLHADDAFDNSPDAEEVAHQSGGNPLLLNLLPPMLQKLDAEEIEDIHSWFLMADETALSGRFLKLAADADLPMLQHLSLVPEPMTQSFIAALAEEVNGDGEAVARLQERRLIEWDAGLKKFSMHPAISTGAYHALGEDASALHEAQHLVARVCVAKAGDFKPEDKWASISDCRLLLRAVELLKSCGEVSKAADIGERLRPHLQQWGEDRLAGGLLSEAGPLAGSIGEITQQNAASNVLRRRGAALHDAGKSGTAIDVYHALLLLAGKYGRAHDRLYASGRLAELYAAVGNIKRADFYGRKQFELARATGSSVLMAAAAGRVGHVLTAAGDYAEAERYYADAAERFHAAENPAGEAKALGYLARTSFVLGHRDKASEAVSHRVEALNRLGKAEEALKARMEMAALYRRTGEADSANAIYEDVARRAKSGGYLSVALDVLQEMARIAFDAADYTRALLLQQERLELANKVGDDRSAGVALGMIAHCHVRTKDIAAALKHYTEARERFVAAGYRRGVARCGHYSARLLASEKHWQDALSSVLDSLDFALDGERGTLEIDLRVLGLCRQALGEAVFQQFGEGRLGEERFAAVIGLMR